MKDRRAKGETMTRREFEELPSGVKMVAGFFSGAGLLALAIALIIAAFLMTGCGKGGSVSTLPPPPPPQDQYEALPATHPLLTTTGKNTGMWIKFISVSPLRGSVVQEKEQVSITLDIYGPGGLIKAWWSADGVLRGQTRINGGINSGLQHLVLNDYYGPPPVGQGRYLIFEVFSDSGESGTSTFLLDYK